MSDDLAGLFLPAFAGAGTQELMAGICTAWDAVTFHSTIVVGTVTYTNLPIMSPALATMGTGLVTLHRTAAAYIITGRLTVPA
jgi:hypothetical protein